jgi:ubiquinone/menaquinone biosynthesis C-methylase UbiE
MDGNTLPIRTGSVNTVFSFWVFQHFDNVGIGFEYLKEAYRVLAPDGTLLLQLPIYHLPRGVSRPLTRLVYGCSKLLGDLRAKYYRERLKRGASLELMRGTEYDAEQVLEVAHSAGFSEVEYRSVYLSASGSRETIVLARK